MTRIGTVPLRGGIGSCEAQGRRRDGVGGGGGVRSAGELEVRYSRRGGRGHSVSIAVSQWFVELEKARVVG